MRPVSAAGAAEAVEAADQLTPHGPPRLPVAPPHPTLSGPFSKSTGARPPAWANRAQPALLAHSWPIGLRQGKGAQASSCWISGTREAGCPEAAAQTSGSQTGPVLGVQGRAHTEEGMPQGG